MAAESSKQEKKMKWFKEARLGLFCHFGVYSQVGRGEWLFNVERWTPEEYLALAKKFNPAKFDADELADLAVKAGAKYVVLTTKHHDGFCLFDTQTTDFNAVAMGPGRDLVKEYVAALRKRGLKVGLYWSYADWKHPETFPEEWMRYADSGVLKRHFPDGWKCSPRFFKHMKQQVTELLTNYGKIDLLWYDGAFSRYANPWRAKDISRLARSLQPNIVLNNRGGTDEDYVSCEQKITPVEDKPWEACFTLNETWGYHAGDRFYKSARDVIMLLFRCIHGGGNLLLNVGPRGDGTIPGPYHRILGELGDWMRGNGEVTYSQGAEKLFSSGLFSIGNCVYFPMPRWPGKEFQTIGFKNNVVEASLLYPSMKVSFTQEPKRITLSGLPAKAPSPLPVFLKLKMRGTPESVVEWR